MHETEQFKKVDHLGVAVFSFYELIKFRSRRKGDSDGKTGHNPVHE